MFKSITVSLVLLASHALADVNAVINDHILARHATFVQSAAALMNAAQTDCTPTGTIAAFHTAFDAWASVNHIRFGPIEDDGEALAVAFWPDKKGMIPRALNRMIAAENPVVNDATAFANYSIAARGFMALEQMLFDPKFSDYEKGSYSCDLTKAITTDISRIATQTNAGWLDGYATILKSAGVEGNTVFLTDKEGVQALYTNMLVGLEYIHSQRLARPLGSFERPRPKRAEARRSTRSLRNIIVSLESLQEMARMLADGEAPETMESFASTIAYAKGLDALVFENLNDLSAKFQLGSLQELVAITHEAAKVELGEHLAVAVGFNALDGD